MSSGAGWRRSSQSPRRRAPPKESQENRLSLVRMCDAVQAETYLIDSVEVSNFVLPFTSPERRSWAGETTFLHGFTTGNPCGPSRLIRVAISDSLTRPKTRMTPLCPMISRRNAWSLKIWRKEPVDPPGTSSHQLWVTRGCRITHISLAPSGSFTHAPQFREVIHERTNCLCAEGIAAQSMGISSPHGVGDQPCESSSDRAADADYTGICPHPLHIAVLTRSTGTQGVYG